MHYLVERLSGWRDVGPHTRCANRDCESVLKRRQRRPADCTSKSIGRGLPAKPVFCMASIAVHAVLGKEGAVG